MTSQKSKSFQGRSPRRRRAKVIIIVFQNTVACTELIVCSWGGGVSSRTDEVPLAVDILLYYGAHLESR